MSQSAAHFAQKHLYSGTRGFSTELRGRHSRGRRGRFSSGGRHFQHFGNSNKPLRQICGRTGHIALKCYHCFDLRYQNSCSSAVSADDASMTVKSHYSGSGKLALGDGSQLSISHVGHFNIPASKPLKLPNILLVPSITKNLVRISKLTLENDVVIEFDSSCSYVKDKSSKAVLLHGILKNGLYQLHIPPAPALVTSAPRPLSLITSTVTAPNISTAHNVSQTTDMSDSCNSATSSSCNAQHVVALWHNRLGHPNRMVLNKVLTQLNLHNLSHTTPLFCDACQYGKLHQHSFPLSDQHTTKPFQIAHSNVWGPAPHLSLDGYKYYVSFVDDFTRYTWIFRLRLKSEVPSVFLHFNTMVKK